jgi:hypothetical protein
MLPVEGGFDDRERGGLEEENERGGWCACEVVVEMLLWGCTACKSCRLKRVCSSHQKKAQGLLPFSCPVKRIYMLNQLKALCQKNSSKMAGGYVWFKPIVGLSKFGSTF